MSLFRKPTKKIQRRVFTADDDEEEDQMDTGDPVAPPPPIISQKKEKPLKSKPTLSFADEEEEDVEIFQVKKSSQSKRMAKLRQKEMNKEISRTNGDAKSNSRDKHINYNEDSEKDQTQKPKQKKRDLEGLILSGRAAVVAGAEGDVSDSDEDKSPDSTDEGGFHRFRADSVRAALDKGGIPDAALIHAARKSRQQAREVGKTGTNSADFIPLRSGGNENSMSSATSERRGGGGGGGRLVREDGSGDEDDDSERIIVRGLIEDDSKKKARAMAVDSEGEEWEEQQMSKAKPTFLHAAITMGDLADTEMNPFAMGMPMPAAPPAPLLPLHARPFEVKPTNVQQLADALVERLKLLDEARLESIETVKTVRTKLEELALKREELQKKTPLLDKAYRRAQAIRGYITDLTECLDEKMPTLEGLESRALALHKRRCEFVVERRRADVRDQAQDILALAARPGSSLHHRSEEDQSRTRRVAEREGRRRARRLAREAQPGRLHRDGDSSDDELPPVELHSVNSERDELTRECKQLFTDAAKAYGSVYGVCRRLAAFRKLQPDNYNDSYCSHSLPKLIAPFVRAELIMWNPIADENNEDFEKMDWYKCLMLYGTSTYNKNASEMSSSEDSYSSSDETNGHSRYKLDAEQLREDPDLLLVPTILEKVLLPKITELISASWDPMCVRSCVRLRGLCVKLSPLVRPQSFRPLATALLQVLKQAAQHDYFLPVVPTAIYDGKGGMYWRRFLGAAIRLLRAILAFNDSSLSPVSSQVAQSLIQSIVLSSMACGSCAAIESASAVWNTIPPRSELGKNVAPKIKLLAEKGLKDLDGNPLHIKSIETARSVMNQTDNVK